MTWSVLSCPQRHVLWSHCQLLPYVTDLLPGGVLFSKKGFWNMLLKINANNTDIFGKWSESVNDQDERVGMQLQELCAENQKSKSNQISSF